MCRCNVRKTIFRQFGSDLVCDLGSNAAERLSSRSLQSETVVDRAFETVDRVFETVDQVSQTLDRTGAVGRSTGGDSR